MEDKPTTEQDQGKTLAMVIQRLTKKVDGIENKVFGDQPKVEQSEAKTPRSSKLDYYMSSLEDLVRRLDRIDDELKIV